MSGERRYRSEDGREWVVTLDAPGRVLSVPPELERSGANLPEHQLQIVFRAGDEALTQEYTAFTPLEDLSDDDLEEWYRAAVEGRGL
jgi:hypothetical protein